MSKPFRNRAEAGRKLAEKLVEYAGRPDVLVLALPRGGVPVGYEVAQALEAPLDVFVVRKLGVPGHEELAMGAVASGGAWVLNDDVVVGLSIPDHVIRAVAARELQELERRERLFRDDRPPPDVRGRTVILVDDGLATGSTMRAAVAAFGGSGPTGSSWRSRPRRPRPVPSSATRSTSASAASRPSHSTPSGSGTRISPRPPTRRSATSSNGPPSGRWPRRENHKELQR